MTTIAYRAGVMACDSQVTDEDSATKQACGPKMFRLGGALVGISGDADERELVAFLRKKRISTPKKLLSLMHKFEGAYRAIIVFKQGEIYELDSAVADASATVMRVGEQEGFYAVGSGAGFAIAAMRGHHEVDAVRAVEVACSIDLYSTTPIHTMRLHEK